jgi:DNA-binding NtrC family response regulator
VLFLDEVTELTPSAQAKILRVLQEREFMRLGGTRSIKANVRVVVATNRDLQDAVSRGVFRADLYYRVNVFAIQVPPLRERGDDILLLARSFLRNFARANHLQVIDLASDAEKVLLTHAWAGNVRELRNAIERASIVCDGSVIRASDLLLAPPATVPDTINLELLEQRAIERALRETQGNRTKAARRLGIARTQLYQRLRKYGLEDASL